MEMERHAGAGAAGSGHRRWEAPQPTEDHVIVLSAGREPRLHRQQQAAAGMGPPEKVFYKTKLCEKYEASGRCMYEDGCTFAHGAAELRPPVPMLLGGPVGGGSGGWRRPLPEHEHARVPGGGGGGGRVCFEFRDKGTCHFGDKCAFAHASAPEKRHPPAGADARRSAGPAARAAAPAPPRGNSYAAAAPAPGRPSPPVNASGAAAGRDRPELDDGKSGALTRLSRKKTSSIYGDWPEQF